jgi:Na+-translocating ferredoxin:NAD+ oxidoreductase subunit B
VNDFDPAYRDLARLLDSLPQGFPATESGAELEILRYLFSPEEARVALALSLKAETPELVAGKAGLEAGIVRSSLKSMVKKGLIEFEKAAGGIGYKLMPFVVGFYERQVGRMDKPFAELFERFYLEGLARAMTMKPSAHRVIVVERSIPVGIEVMPYERASTCIDAAKSWGLLNCICRLQAALVGRGCNHSLESCLALSPRENAFAQATSIRALTREEALQVLKDTEAEGLVHTTANAQAGISYICNCCSCACGFLRAAKELGIADPLARSHFLCACDTGVCTACGNCVEACQFGALSLSVDGACVVDSAKCFGCGLCVSACPAGALALKRKDGFPLESPPITEHDWEAERALNRGLTAEYEKLRG